MLSTNRAQQHQLTSGGGKEIDNSSGGPNAGIDLRPIKLPARVRIPLYPFTGSFPYKSAVRSFFSKSDVLNDLVCSACGASAQQVVLGDSGTAVLILWLEWLRLQSGGHLTVALPSLFCEDTALAIQDSGIRVVLFEISDAFQLSHASVDFVIQERCNVLIWPNYFGYRLRDQDVLKKARDNSLLVVFDEAHTFPPVAPCSYELPQEITLFSFAGNKPVAGNGGGGMYFPDPTMASSINRFAHRKKLSHQPIQAAVFRDAKSVIWTRIQWRTRIRRGLRWLDEESDSGSRLPDGPFPVMNQYQREIAVLRWRMRCEAMPAHSEHVATLQTEILKLWNPVSVQMLSPTCDVPAIFTVRVPSRFRYMLSVALAAQGIETTWHYYPLHRLPSFQDCSCKPMPVSDQLAGELLVLPCQWIHTLLHLQINAQDLEASMKWLMANGQ